MVFEEVVESRGVGFVERIEKGGVEGTEGEFVDYVGEVEGCQPILVSTVPNIIPYGHHRKEEWDVPL